MPARLEKLHGNDSAVAFMLLDHYFSAKDLDIEPDMTKKWSHE